MGLATGIVIGLAIGWLVFPRPKFMDNWATKIRAKLGLGE